MWTHVRSTHLLLLFPVPPAYLYLTGMPVSDWLHDWHTLAYTCIHGFAGRTIVLFRLSKVMCTTTIQPENKRETMERQSLGNKDVKMLLTIVQCCGGYSLAWFWDPVHGSPLWRHCRYTRLGRHWHCQWSGQRASAATSTARLDIPFQPQNSCLLWTCSAASPLPTGLFLSTFFLCVPAFRSTVTPHKPGMIKYLLIKNVEKEKWQ